MVPLGTSTRGLDQGLDHFRQVQRR